MLASNFEKEYNEKAASIMFVVDGAIEKTVFTTTSGARFVAGMVKTPQTDTILKGLKKKCVDSIGTEPIFTCVDFDFVNEKIVLKMIGENDKNIVETL